MTVRSLIATLPWVALGLYSCKADDSKVGADPVDTGADASPAPYIVEEDDPPVANFSADQITAAILDAMTAAKGIHAAPVLDAYNTVMDGQDNACPNYYEQDGNEYWYDYCTSNAGVTYNGYSFYYAYDNYNGGDGMIYNGGALYGVAQVTDAQGHTFEAGGSAVEVIADATDGSYRVWQSQVQGSFSYDGASAGGTWLAEDLAPDLVMYAYYLPTYDGHAFFVDGAVSGLGGDFDVVVFDNASIFDQNSGGGCGLEPSGLVSVRDNDGNWYDVMFDGPAEYGGEYDAAACDGCGSAWFRGEEVGQVCLDFSALTDWGSAPW